MSDSDIGITDEQLEHIAERVAEKLGSIPTHQHARDHIWIKEKIKDEEAAKGSRRRVVERIVGTVSTAGVLAFLGWVGSLVIDMFSTWGGAIVDTAQEHARQVGGKK